MEKLSCPICNEQLVLLHQLRFNVYRCCACKLLHSNAVFDYSFAPALNEEKRAQGLRKLRMSNFTVIAEELKKLTAGKSKVSGLEIGSGNGWWLQTCQSKQIKCTGIEPDNTFADDYRKAGLNVVSGFYPNAAVSRQEGYNFIIFNDVFEHIDSLSELMAALKRDMADDGLLIINIPMSNGIFYRLATVLYNVGIKSYLERMWQFNFPSPHINYFNEKNLELLMENNGFAKVSELALASLDNSSMNERVSADRNVGSFKAFCVSAAVRLLSPILLTGRPDIKVFFFKKA